MGEKERSDDKFTEIDSPLPKINKPERKRVSPIFHVETFSGKERGVRDENNKIDFGVSKDTEEAVKDILISNIPKETNINPISDGCGRVEGNVLTYYNPHNCRVYYFFKKEGFNPKNQCSYLGCNYSLINSTEHQFENFNGFTIRVKKTFVEVRPLNTIFHVIEMDKVELAELREERIRQALISSCTVALKDFVRVYGGKTDFVVHHWKILENKFMGDVFTNQIPLRAKWRNAETKKVYNERNVEIADGVSDIDGNSFYSNWTRNAVLKNVIPEVNSRLVDVESKIDKFIGVIDKLNDSVGGLNKSVGWLDSNLITHKEVLGGINEGIKADVVVKSETLSAIKSLKGEVSNLNKVNTLSVQEFKREKVKSLLRDYGW